MSLSIIQGSVDDMLGEDEIIDKKAYHVIKEDGTLVAIFWNKDDAEQYAQFKRQMELKDNELRKNLKG